MPPSHIEAADLKSRSMALAWHPSPLFHNPHTHSINTYTSARRAMRAAGRGERRSESGGATGAPERMEGQSARIKAHGSLSQALPAWAECRPAGMLQRPARHLTACSGGIFCRRRDIRQDLQVFKLSSSFGNSTSES
jgi:hypothetical protein